MFELLDAESPEVRPPQGPADDAIDIILKSRSFERATASRQLLAYLWAHRKEELSEYTLAVEALGRRPDFDPRIDATVRVQVSRLRQRLHEFSQCYEAKLCTVELAIPVGTHQLQVVERPVAEPSAANHAADAVAGAAGQSAGHLRYLFASVTACVLIAMGMVAYLQLRGAGRQVVEAHTPQSQFWSAFLGPGKITRILLPTPIFSRWTMPSSSSG